MSELPAHPLQVVITLRITAQPDLSHHELQDQIADAVHEHLDWLGPAFLSVAIREIGAGGESMEHEGTWPPGHLDAAQLALTDDVQTVDTTGTQDVDSKGRL